VPKSLRGAPLETTSGDERLAKEVVLYFIVLIAMAFAIPAIHSATSNWSKGVGVVVQETSVGVYSDYGHTAAVNSLDFGSLQRGSQQKYITLYLYNSGTGTVTIHWSSTLASVTPKITDAWRDSSYSPSSGSNIEGHQMSPGASYTTYYWITIASDITANSYNWTLTLSS
jgi:hypothetical protein